MKTNKAYFFIIPAILAAVACNNSGLKKTKSGLLYKIISDGKGETAKRGQFLKINFTQKVRDSVLYSSAEGMPTYVRVDSVGPNYTALEIFPLLRKGDSAVVIQLGDSIQRKSGQMLPPFIKKRDKIILSFRVTDLFPTEDLLKKDREIEIEKEHQKESEALKNYIERYKINAQKTEKGTYVEIKSEGDGPKVDTGKQISVLYTGKLFPSGKVFESNVNTPGAKPVQFVVGRRGMIQGWDDGLRLFRKGGKGTLYIPAYLAYDAQPGPDNKPFANLIFDVEVVDVTDAPKPVPHAFPPTSQKIQPPKTDSTAKPAKK